MLAVPLGAVERRGIHGDEAQRRPAKVHDDVVRATECEGDPHDASGRVETREVEVERVANVPDLGGTAGGELAGNAARHQPRGIGRRLRQERREHEVKHAVTLLAEADGSNPSTSG